MTTSFTQYLSFLPGNVEQNISRYLKTYGDTVSQCVPIGKEETVKILGANMGWEIINSIKNGYLCTYQENPPILLVNIENARFLYRKFKELDYKMSCNGELDVEQDDITLAVSKDIVCYTCDGFLSQ